MPTNTIIENFTSTIISGVPFEAPAWLIAGLTQAVEGDFFILEEHTSLQLADERVRFGDVRYINFDGRPSGFGTIGVDSNVGCATPRIELNVLASASLDPDALVTLLVEFEGEPITRAFGRPDYNREYPGGLALDQWNALVDLSNGIRSLNDETLPVLLTKGYVRVEVPYADTGFAIVITDTGQALIDGDQ